MSTINPGIGRVLAGVGGAALIVALFLPWSESGAASQSGWEALATWDLFLVITGGCGVTAAMTGGRFGFFRPDLSFNAMTDIFGVVASILIIWLIIDFPSGADQGAGVYLALAGALTIATGAGDFKIKSLFPRVGTPAADRSA
jgi:hypothetical protein